MLAATLLASGCGGPGAGSGQGTNVRAVPCAPDREAALRTCSLDVVRQEAGLLLTLRRPDGGFRRLDWPDGGALAPADGAERIAVTRLAIGIEARIGGWRYRLEPAVMR